MQRNRTMLMLIGLGGAGKASSLSENMPMKYTEAFTAVGWLVDWGLTSHQQLRSYGDGTLVYSPIRQTGEVLQL